MTEYVSHLELSRILKTYEKRIADMQKDYKKLEVVINANNLLHKNDDALSNKFNEWMIHILQVALNHFPVNLNARDRKMDLMQLRRALIYVARTYFENATLTQIGNVVARATARYKDFDHSTVLHAIDEHNEVMQKANFNFEYYTAFKGFEAELKVLELIDKSK